MDFLSLHTKCSPSLEEIPFGFSYKSPPLYLYWATLFSQPFDKVLSQNGNQCNNGPKKIFFRYMRRDLHVDSFILSKSFSYEFFFASNKPVPPISIYYIDVLVVRACSSALSTCSSFVSTLHLRSTYADYRNSVMVLLSKDCNVLDA